MCSLAPLALVWRTFLIICVATFIAVQVAIARSCLLVCAAGLAGAVYAQGQLFDAARVVGQVGMFARRGGALALALVLQVVVVVLLLLQMVLVLLLLLLEMVLVEVLVVVGELVVVLLLLDG